MVVRLSRYSVRMTTKQQLPNKNRGYEKQCQLLGGTILKIKKEETRLTTPRGGKYASLQKLRK